MKINSKTFRRGFIDGFTLTPLWRALKRVLNDEKSLVTLGAVTMLLIAFLAGLWLGGMIYG